MWTCSYFTNIVRGFRYVLISRPSDWTDELRFKFLEGLDAFLELLKCMQVTRQEGAHLRRWTSGL